MRICKRFYYLYEHMHIYRNYRLMHRTVWAWLSMIETNLVRRSPGLVTYVTHATYVTHVTHVTYVTYVTFVKVRRSPGLVAEVKRRRRRSTLFSRLLLEGAPPPRVTADVTVG